jgi:hypothetical protein
MKKYVALGCSLTAQDGFINYINQTYNLEIENLAVSAGSNGLQMHRLNNLLVDGSIGEETTLLWQITSPQRPFDIHAEVDEEFKNGTPFIGFFDWIPEKINLYNSQSTVLLCNTKYYRNTNTNINFNMQTLCCDLYKWSKIVKKIIVYFGWNSLVDESKIQSFLNPLKNLHNVEILNSDLSIVDWCKTQKLHFDDSIHPTKESYIQWGKQVLVPTIFKI